MIRRDRSHALVKRHENDLGGVVNRSRAERNNRENNFPRTSRVEKRAKFVRNDCTRSGNAKGRSAQRNTRIAEISSVDWRYRGKKIEGPNDYRNAAINRRAR